MAGPLWRFGRGERAKRRGLPEMSRGLLTPPRAAPFCVRQLEVQVRRNHPGTLRDTSLSRKYLVETAFADQSRTQMPFAEGGQATCLARLARPGSGELSLELSAGASTSSRHRCVCPTKRRPGSRDRQNLHSDFAHICRPGLVTRPTRDYIGDLCTGLGRGRSPVSRHVPSPTSHESARGRVHRIPHTQGSASGSLFDTQTYVVH